MARVIVRFPDGYVNLEAEEFHEDGDFIKAYNSHNELVGIFKTNYIECAYQTNKKEQ